MENLNEKAEITTTKNYQRELKKWTKRLLLFIGIGSTSAGVVNAGQAQPDLLALIKANQITVTQDNTRVADDDVYRTNPTTPNNENNDPETGGEGDPIFVFKNGKLVLTDSEKYTKLQPLLDKFYKIKDKKLIKLTENGIITIFGDDKLKPYFKNILIQQFLNAALGNGELAYRTKGTMEPHQTNFKAIREMANNPVNLDKKGNISETQKLLQKVIDQANEKPLKGLKTGAIFNQNWNDAKSLFYAKKSVELAGKKNKTIDDKTMLAMNQFYMFKSLTSTIDIVDMKGFLYGQTGNGSYMEEGRLSDRFVINQYLTFMGKMEGLFEKELLVKVESNDADWD